jgi:hypothetical protein
LEEALEGRIRQIPFNAIQALDVVMRHLVNAFTIIFNLQIKGSLLQIVVLMLDICHYLDCLLHNYINDTTEQDGRNLVQC